MMSTFTPGPWKQHWSENISSIREWLVTYGNDPISIACVFSERNAHLIAAAPEMYEILEGIKEACLFDDDDGQIGVTTEPHITEDLFKDICRTLAKARGEK
jgi:hypothetical protein